MPDIEENLMTNEGLLLCRSKLENELRERDEKEKWLFKQNFRISFVIRYEKWKCFFVSMPGYEWGKSWLIFPTVTPYEEIS